MSCLQARETEEKNQEIASKKNLLSVCPFQQVPCALADPACMGKMQVHPYLKVHISTHENPPSSPLLNDLETIRILVDSWAGLLSHISKSLG
jgi:hypothetical protein